jgi:uncharacterized protein (DUF58 family)
MTSVSLGWRGSAHQGRVATVTVAALAAPLLAGRAELLALAAPLLVLLALGRTSHLPRSVAVSASLDTARCYEGDVVEVVARVDAGMPVDLLSLTLRPTRDPQLFEIEEVGEDRRADGVGVGELERVWHVRPQHWGRHRFELTVQLRAAGRMREATVVATVGELVVFPHPASADATVVPTELLARLGDHLSRAMGEGLEFAETRAYAPGDRAKRINWYASSRRGRLYVNSYVAERAADVVVMVDAFSDVGAPPDSTLDRSLRGATALVQAYLKVADRVGVVAIGGTVHWLSANSAHRQFFRIAQALLAVRREPDVVAPVVPFLPRAALPRGALVVLFTPLLENPAIEAVWGLRDRGYAVVVVDVLSSEPRVRTRSGTGALALRLWRLDRHALRYRLATRGIPVVSWDGHEPLGARLRPLGRRPILGRPG